MKKALKLMLILALCIGLCACGSEDAKDNNASTEPPVSETANTTEAKTEPETVPEPTIEVNKVAVGETIKTDFVEITFDEAVVAKDIKYSVTTGIVTRITGPEPVEGQQYVCLSGTIKNTSTSPLPVFDFFIGEFDLNGYKYKVDATDCDILDGEGQTQTNIDPLMEYKIRVYVAVPDDLANNHSSCTLYFGFYDLFDNAELSKNRAFEEEPITLCPYQYLVTIK